MSAHVHASDENGLRLRPNRAGNSPYNTDDPTNLALILLVATWTNTKGRNNPGKLLKPGQIGTH